MRKVAGKIIDFLAQLEDFQKKLWLKKKFVVGTSYLITVGNIDEQFHDEICANDAQRDEWVRLFAIDTIEGDLVTSGYSVPLTAKFLQSHPTLTLNTDLFDCKFASRLLESCDDCDGNADLVLVHGDIGQVDFYVRYWEAEVRWPDDNPTIGLILCAEKSEAIARYTLLSDHQSVFAAKYLPTEAELQVELQRERHVFELRQLSAGEDE